MNERIQAIIKSVGLKRIEFAKRLCLSAPYISELCSGKTYPSDRTIADICREFNVNETWLRMGEGEMFAPRSRSDEINEFINKALQGKPESFKLRLISALSRLNEADWEVLEHLATKLAEGEDKSDTSAPDSACFSEMTDEEAHRELDRQLRDEKEQAEKSPASQKSNSSSAKLA